MSGSARFATAGTGVGAAFVLAGAPGAAAAARFRARRENVEDLLDPADARYFRRQEWQEGAARYAEIHIASRAARADGDVFGPPEYAHEQGAAIERLLARLDNFDLAQERRRAFYALGAGAAFLLELECPGWKQAYREAARFNLPAACQGG